METPVDTGRFGAFGAINTNPRSNHGSTKKSHTPYSSHAFRLRRRRHSSSNSHRHNNNNSNSRKIRQNSAVATATVANTDAPMVCATTRGHSTAAHLLAPPLSSWRGPAAAAAWPPRYTPLVLSRTPMPTVYAHRAYR